ncbi:CehA/McbA family metallohydrolase domain-containing protein [Candidatus Laterigemmans baculatus]|uniref:hypothetical protein n=1 Tax=Candidatus Laterigemmans baculatus TaxID=2770505 RepID=UPI0013DA0CAC|nr:hypothetical protein [Candidatus Laterigemmans baculatus]
MKRSALLALLIVTASCSLAWAASLFLLQVVDEVSGEPVPVRILLSRENGSRAPIRRAIAAIEGTVGGGDTSAGVVLDGEVELSLPPGTYQFEISRGPEYRILSGSFTVDRDSDDSRVLELPRIADLPAEGWIAGDLMAAATPRQIGTLMASEALPVAGLLPGDKPFDGLQLRDGYHARSDLLRGSGAASGLLAIGFTPPDSGSPDSPAEAASAPNAAPSSDFLREIAGAASRSDRLGSPRLVITNPLAWDVPIWLASGRIDGVVVLGDFLQLDRRHTPADSRLPTKMEYRDARGVGRWAEHIYYQMLEAGLRPAPAAASGSGLVANPIGYNRVYVYLGGTEAGRATGEAAANWSGDDWWNALWQGRSVVTNGPLLRPTLDGYPPGHRFQAHAGEALELTPELKLAIRDPVEYLDVIRDGQVVYHARLDEFAKAGGMIPPLRFEQSGWVAIRVMTKYESHYRAAISAPWFIDFDGQPRVSTRGVEFFRQWLSDREQMLLKLSPESLRQHAPYVRAARAFWQEQAEAANAP